MRVNQVSLNDIHERNVANTYSTELFLHSHVDLITFLDITTKGSFGTEWKLILDRNDGESWPSEEEIARLIKVSVSEVYIKHPITISQQDAQRSLEFIRFLRDAISYGLQIEWKSIFKKSANIRYFIHLPPPSSGIKSRVWNREYSYGKMFWRKGPGFILIKDMRSVSKQTRYIFDDMASLEAFQNIQTPIHLSEMQYSSKIKDAIHEFISEGIALQIGEYILALPYRMRNWPIPYTAI